MNRATITAIIFFVFLVFFILETTIINFPFVFIFCAALLVLVKKVYTAIGAVIAGLIIDSLRVDGFGITPFFLIGVILIILLYERYSGSSDLLLAGVIIALFTFLYSRLLDYSMTMTVGFIVISFIVWQVYKILEERRRF